MAKTNGSLLWVSRAFLLGGLVGAHGFALAQSMSFLQALDLARQNDPKYQMVRQDVLVRREQVAQALTQDLPNLSRA